MEHILSPYAITDKNDDKLHRDTLVANISQAIIETDLAQSYAIGICGKWGCGKTSIINLVKQNLNESEHNVEFIDFNPWMYSDQVDLTRQFFSELSRNLLPSKNLIKKISNATEKTLDIASLFSDNAKTAEKILKYAGIIGGTDQGSPKEMKTEISEALKKTQVRYVVVMDDIDRLDNDEIRMMFKLIRSVADFSNVVYLVAYDEDIICDALGTEQYDGVEYVQKNVQLPIRVPEPTVDAISMIMREEYKNITNKEKTSPEDDVIDMLSEYLYSIRDVHSLMDRFRIKYAISKNELNSDNLLVFTWLEMKSPKTLMWLRQYMNNNPGIHSPFASQASYNTMSDELAKIDPIHCELIMSMHPDTRRIRGSLSLYSANGLLSATHHEKYYVLNPEMTSISEKDIRKILESNAESMMNALIKCKNRGILIGIIGDISYFFDSASDEQKELLLDVLLLSKSVTSEDFRSKMKETYYDVTDLIRKLVGDQDAEEFFQKKLDDVDYPYLYKFCRVLNNYYPLDPRRRTMTIPQSLIARINEKVENESKIIDSPLTSITFYMGIYALDLIDRAESSHLLKQYAPSLEKRKECQAFLDQNEKEVFVDNIKLLLK